MIFDTFQKRAVLMLALAFIGLSVGCSEKDGKDANEQKSVANVTQLSKEAWVGQRALERMNALIAMDWEKAYGFMSPSRRKIVPYSVFEKRNRVAAILRKRAEVKKVDCNENTCDVSLMLDHVYIGGVIDAMQGQENTSTVREKWVFIRDNWWFVPE